MRSRFEWVLFEHDQVCMLNMVLVLALALALCFQKDFVPQQNGGRCTSGWVLELSPREFLMTLKQDACL